jgi:polyisoprenoid-binding protein YceI
MTSLRLLLSTLVLVFGGPALAGWTKSGESVASFRGVGPAGFKIEGKTKSVEVKDDGKALTVVVGLKDLETGISLRDNHMRQKYLEVDANEVNAVATLTVPLSEVTWPDDGKTVEADPKKLPKGTFALHGKSKEVSFKYKITNSGGTFTVVGEAPINFNEYDVKVPSYMGITVKPDITVFTTFNLKKN